jgi:acetyl esterase
MYFKKQTNNRTIISRLIIATGFLFLLGAGAGASAKVEPTYKDVAYGAHPRAVLDFWKADSNKPTPVVVFIHGGGFYLGDKTNVSDSDIKKCLDHGVSFASISYPYYQDVALQSIIRDYMARSIQFLRYKAPEWNIDKTKVAVYGQSAGAGSSLWLDSHDDITDPGSADPVLRESSRVAAAGLIDTQATYDFTAWYNLFENVLDPKTIKGWLVIMNRTMLDMYHLKNMKQLKAAEFAPVLRDLDMLSMMDKSDPPIIMETFTADFTKGDLLHNERHPKAVKEKCDAVGMKCTLVLDGTPADQRVGVIDFLIEHIK